MKAEELRIGNWIYDRGGKAWQIDHWETINKVSAKANAVMCNGILMGTHPLSEYVDYLKPIPLTEEWLLKLGFYRRNDRIYSKLYGVDEIDGVFQLQKFEDGYEFRTSFDSEWFYTPPIYHVHQLQNLYFALTGEELTIKN
jgi:hypothetical protein